MSTHHSAPPDATPRPLIARTIRLFAVPTIVGWIALTVVVNVIAPQLEKVGAAHSVPRSEEHTSELQSPA